MKDLANIGKALMWLTELGLSAAVPLMLFLYGALWLRDRFGLGPWVLILGAALGLYGAYGGLKGAFKAMGLLPAKKKREEPEVHAFNNHD